MKKNTPQATNADMALGKRNYIIILAGVALIVIGFMLMSGGGSDDPNVFNEEIFSTRRIVVAPLVLLAGLMLPIYGIMSQPKSKKTE